MQIAELGNFKIENGAEWKGLRFESCVKNPVFDSASGVGRLLPHMPDTIKLRPIHRLTNITMYKNEG